MTALCKDVGTADLARMWSALLMDVRSCLAFFLKNSRAASTAEPEGTTATCGRYPKISDQQTSGPEIDHCQISRRSGPFSLKWKSFMHCCELWSKSTGIHMFFWLQALGDEIPLFLLRWGLPFLSEYLATNLHRTNTTQPVRIHSNTMAVNHKDWASDS